ncbi:hypothetical protein F2S73_05600 [Pseudomonas syringae pv. actinidiae]|nr:hypothetical protein [Pseudomonas syringae pv. actinidiae]NVL34364.1 hypothetical protein [Pseudomonas syringae pv. actinidiae]
MNIEERLLLTESQRNYAPQNYVPTGTELSIPENFIISRDINGEPLSLYDHDVWRMGAYSSALTTFNFRSWYKGDSTPLHETIVSEMKKIQFSRLYFFPKPRKVQSVRMHALRSLAKLALTNGISLKELLSHPSSESKILRAITSLSKKPAADEVVRLLVDIHTISKVSAHSNLIIIDGLIVRADSIVAATFGESERTEQTWLIPTRIYAAMITEFSVNLDNFNSIGGLITEFYRRRKNEPEYGFAISNPSKDKSIPDWETATLDLGIYASLLKMGINNVKKLNAYINDVVSVSKYWIHIFSGMRDGEVNTLPSNAFQSIRINGKEIPVIVGYTYKGSSERFTHTTWITSEAAEKAFSAAITVGEIARIKNEYPELDSSEYPLFPIVSHAKAETRAYHFKVPLRTSITLPNLLKTNSAFQVTEQDIRELEIFDGFTDWRNTPRLSIGKPWPLKTHQCRRSLAVYGARSGKLSLGSMSLQYKHLTENMGSYYRHGSIFAVNFIDDADQLVFIDDFETNIKLSQYELYEADVINSTSSLWGGEGNRIQAAADRGAPLIITTDRELTKSKFEKGEMVYKQGPSGGCTNPNPCELIKFTNLIPCTHCSFSILNAEAMPKVNKFIKGLRKSIAFLPENSPFSLQVQMEIENIITAVEKAGYANLLEI